MGLGGIAVADGKVLLGCRDATDSQDVWVAFDAETGDLLWEVAYPAPGRLDYGNSPRSTPLIHDGLAWLLGAFGHLTCLDLETGVQLWQRSLTADFGTPPLDWGLVGSPLLVGERLIVQPGGVRGSLVALDPFTGETLWASGTTPPGHAAPIALSNNGREQVVAYDRVSLGGWDAATGERLWTMMPRHKGDFNVPTPIAVDDGLLVSTENNGTRQYAFQPDGGLSPGVVAEVEALAPDSHTPVVAAGRVFGVWNGLYCLDLASELRPLWTADRPDFNEYAALIASDRRLLCLTQKSELLLIDAEADEYSELGRWRLLADRGETLSHPALAGRRLYVRLGRELCCLQLEGPEP